MSKVLVVDDEAIITMQLEERLSIMGYTVAGMAATGEDAIEKTKLLKPDIVLMDIVMPGKMNGIDAADVIRTKFDIPVIFVTSYADDAIIQKAKSVKPYGYIVKPFNEQEIKAAIEIALFKKSIEQKTEKKIKKSLKKYHVPAEEGEDAPSDEINYFDLPEMKTILLNDVITDIILYLYTEQAMKDQIFKYIIDEGIKKGGRNIFAYSYSTLLKFYPKEIQKKTLNTHRIKQNELVTLYALMEKCTESFSPQKSSDSLHILLDFSITDEYDMILEIIRLLVEKKNAGIPITGVVAVNIDKINHNQITNLSDGISKIIVSTGKETSFSFSDHSFPVGSVSVVPQSTIDEVVKKSLEPVILSLLDKPLSGYDIVHEIHSKYNVLIPQARVYALLHEYSQQGYLEIKSSGKSKLFVPTEKGKKFFNQKIADYKLIFSHIFGSEIGIQSECIKKE